MLSFGQEFLVQNFPRKKFCNKKKKKNELTTTFAEALDGCRAPTISGT